jgi:predicted secreted Zn-dependent protease
MLDPKEIFFERLQRAILRALRAGVALFVLFLVVFFYVPTGWYRYSAGTFDNAQIDGATIAYYPVSGSTEDELRAAIHQGLPLLADGRQPSAVTKWYVSWSATFDTTPDCKTIAANVSSTMLVILPRWTDPQDGSLYLNLHWKELFQYLVRHEATHVRINLEGVRNIRAALLSSDCYTADANAKEAYDMTMRQNQLFDDRTSRGLEPFVAF